ncbi:MAG: FAD-dependent oxidoreductase [Ilumatobacteraceae bacterium]
MSRFGVDPERAMRAMHAPRIRASRWSRSGSTGTAWSAGGSGGVLDVYGDPRRLEHAAASAAGLAEFGLGPDVLDAAAARRLEPALTDRVRGGVFHRTDAPLHPESSQPRCTASSSLGVEVRSGTTVTGWSVEPDRVVITTRAAVSSGAGRRGAVEARQVVVAAGTGTATFQELLGVRIPVIGARGLSVTGAAVRMPAIPLLLGERHIAVAPLGDDVRLSGGFEIGRRTSGGLGTSEASRAPNAGAGRGRVRGSRTRSVGGAPSGVGGRAADHRGVAGVGSSGDRDRASDGGTLVRRRHGADRGPLGQRCAARLRHRPFDPRRFRSIGARCSG